MNQRLRIISGGQTGADQGALLAAKAAGFQTGGYAPKGWMTEDDSAPWLADFGLVECQKPGYPARTRANVADADACLWFGNPYSPGGKLTINICEEIGIPHYVANTVSKPADVADWIKGWVLPISDATVLMVAGNRESGALGIGDKVRMFMGDVLKLLAKERP